MKITLVVAISQDGFINHIGQKHAYEWTSPEDHKHFASMLDRNILLFMGRNTYEANKDGMHHSTRHLRVVFTYNPENYKAIPGTLEFTNEPVEQAVKRLEGEGYEEATLVGGGVLFTQFLEAGLVDDAFVTLEPQTFGEGIPFLVDGHKIEDYTYLKLESSKTLNAGGTKLLHYTRM